MARRPLLAAAGLLALLAFACRGGDAPAPLANLTPTPGVTPAIMPDDVRGFLAQFLEDTVIQEECAAFRQDLAEADCGPFGTFGLIPPPDAPVAGCDVLLVGDEPVAVACATGAPRQLLYYAIQL